MNCKADKISLRTAYKLTEITQSATGFFRALSAVSFSLDRSIAVTCSILKTFSSSKYITYKTSQNTQMLQHKLLFQFSFLNKTLLGVFARPDKSCVCMIKSQVFSFVHLITSHFTVSTFMPVVPEGICERSYTSLDFMFWTNGSEKARPWKDLNPWTVFLQFVTNLLKKYYNNIVMGNRKHKY